MNLVGSHVWNHNDPILIVLFHDGKHIGDRRCSFDPRISDRCDWSIKAEGASTKTWIRHDLFVFGSKTNVLSRKGFVVANQTIRSGRFYLTSGTTAWSKLCIRSCRAQDLSAESHSLQIIRFMKAPSPQEGSKILQRDKSRSDLYPQTSSIISTTHDLV